MSRAIIRGKGNVKKMIKNECLKWDEQRKDKVFTHEFCSTCGSELVFKVFKDRFCDECGKEKLELQKVCPREIEFLTSMFYKHQPKEIGSFHKKTLKRWGINIDNPKRDRRDVTGVFFFLFVIFAIIVVVLCLSYWLEIFFK